MISLPSLFVLSFFFTFYFCKRKFTLTVRCLAMLKQKVQVGSAVKTVAGGRSAGGFTAKKGASHVDSQ